MTKSISTAKIPAKKEVSTKSKPALIKPHAIKPLVDKVADEKHIKKIKKDKKSIGKSEHKVLRDSFTMPQDDYAKIGELKQICLKAGLHVKKSELLRAGLRALSTMSVAQLKQAIGKLDTIKTGRPKKLTT